MKKDEIYVLEQPKHLIQSIIVVDLDEFPVSEKIHDSLGKLSEVSDIIFVFSEFHFSGQKTIVKRKFSSLYQASAYIDSSSNILGNSIFKALLYSREIFDNHLSYTISKLSDLENVEDTEFDGLLKITGSSILKPIYKERKLSNSELYQNYKLIERNVQKNIGYIDFIRWYLLGEDSTETVISDNRMYSNWYTDSSFMYYRTGTIKLFCEKYLSDPEFKLRLETFDEDDPKYLFSSITRFMGIEVLSLNIKDVKI